MIAEKSAGSIVVNVPVEVEDMEREVLVETVDGRWGCYDVAGS